MPCDFCGHRLERLRNQWLCPTCEADAFAAADGTRTPGHKAGCTCARCHYGPDAFHHAPPGWVGITSICRRCRLNAQHGCTCAEPEPVPVEMHGDVEVPADPGPQPSGDFIPTKRLRLADGTVLGPQGLLVAYDGRGFVTHVTQDPGQGQPIPRGDRWNEVYPGHRFYRARVV